MFKKIKGKFRSLFGGNEEEPEKEVKEQVDEEQAEEKRDDKRELNEGKGEDKELAIKEEKVDKEEKEETEEEVSGGFLSSTLGKLASKKISEEDFDKIWLDIEIFLLEINIAYEIVEKIKENLKGEIVGKNFNRFNLKKTIRDVLISEVKEILKSREGNFYQLISNISSRPIKIMMVGVNGSGKTTTIAKLVKYLRDKGLSSVVAASDTFRAAAIEQLDEHAKSLGFKIIKHSKGSDPAAVAFDAVKHAESKEVDVVIIDTAGRMPNNVNLIMELQKIKRVVKVDLVVMVGDSNAGNDLMEQIDLFDKALGLDGIILTKVDTDERPGSIVTTAYSIDKPLLFLGVGQGYDDLVEFDSEKVAESLFD